MKRNSVTPRRQLHAGGAGFSAAVVVGFILTQYGVEVPAPVQTALGSLLTSVSVLLAGFMED